jgi:hypothetical protein
MEINNKKCRLAQVDVNLVIAKLDRVTVNAAGRFLNQLAGGYIVLPAMPRATDNWAFQVALAERPAVMKAYAIDGKELTVNISDGDRFAVHLELADLPCGDLFPPRCPLEGHSVSYLPKSAQEYSFGTL